MALAIPLGKGTQGMKPNGTMLADHAQVIDADGRQPWDRRGDESPKAFKAFAAFRDLNERRTFEAVARLLRCSGANVRRWASRHAWHERTLAYDVWMDERQREDLARDRMLARGRHTKLAVALEGIAARAISEWQAKIQNGQALNLSVEETVALVKAGTELEARALGPEREGAQFTRIEVNLLDAEPIPDAPLPAGRILDDSDLDDGLDDSHANLATSPRERGEESPAH